MDFFLLAGSSFVPQCRGCADRYLCASHGPVSPRLLGFPERLRMKKAQLSVSLLAVSSVCGERGLN